jgi:hypothetical protein
VRNGCCVDTGCVFSGKAAVGSIEERKDQVRGILWRYRLWRHSIDKLVIFKPAGSGGAVRCGKDWVNQPMSVEPQKFFVGVIDFFSILLPGALLTYFLKNDVGPELLGATAPSLASDIMNPVAKWRLDWREAKEDCAGEGRAISDRPRTEMKSELSVEFMLMDKCRKVLDRRSSRRSKGRSVEYS